MCIFANRSSLFPQISQPFLDGLHLEFEFCQIGFQLLDLFRLGLEAALEVVASAAALAATITTAPTFASTFFTSTSFIMGHGISPFRLF
jgi:hypothetical protein